MVTKNENQNSLENQNDIKTNIYLTKDYCK